MLLTSYAGQSTKVSGPITASIIAPNNFLSKFPNAPVFILLGDAHNSSDNLCIDKQSFLDIRKIEFYISLCALLKPNEKIDYYYEGGDLRSGTLPDYAGALMRTMAAEVPMNAVWGLIDSYIKLKVKADIEAGIKASKLANDAKTAKLAKASAIMQADEADVLAKLAKVEELNKLSEAATDPLRQLNKTNQPIPADQYKQLKKEANDAFSAYAAACKLHKNAIIAAKASKDIYNKLVDEPLVQQKLPTPIPLVLDNIRWQVGDIRFWTKFTDEQKLPDGRKYITVDYLINKITYYNSTYKRAPTTENFINIFKAVLKTAKETSNAILDPRILVTTDDLCKKYFDDPYSMISHQLSKILDVHTIDYFKDKLKQYIIYTLGSLCIKLRIDIKTLENELRSAYKTMTDASINLDAISTTNGDLYELHKNKKRFNICVEFIGYIKVIEPDMYMFARCFTRMLVRPDDGFPIINVCYYGRHHTENMHHFLLNILNIGDYVLLSYVDSIYKISSGISRCIELTNPSKTTPLSYILAIMRHFKIKTNVPAHPELSIYHEKNVSAIH